MKIYEYNFNSTKIPSILIKIKNNYTHISNNIYHNFIYNNIIDFTKSKIFILNKNNENLSYAFIFKVKNTMVKKLNLPNESFIIRDVFTFKNHRRKGYCKKLMDWIYNKYMEDFIFLEVNASNINALKCYSFLKPYFNDKLKFYYDKYFIVLNNNFDNYSSLTQTTLLDKYPHMLSSFLLFSN
jgi:hypothetical protein